MKSISLRREKDKSKKEKAKRILKNIFHVENPTEKQIGHGFTTHSVPCSCSMCCNKRRIEKGYKKLTVQERRAEDEKHDI